MASFNELGLALAASTGDRWVGFHPAARISASFSRAFCQASCLLSGVVMVMGHPFSVEKR
jgi:hypothetical protein